MQDSRQLLRQSFIDKYNYTKSLPNLHLNFNAVGEEEVHPFEQIYFHGVIKCLVEWSQFSDHNFYLIGSNSPWDYSFDNKSIVFYLSNEDHIVPDSILKAKAIFTPYLPKNGPKNIFPIPLGYNGSVPKLDVIPINERNVDVFFSGNLHKRRLPFYLGVKAYQFSQQFRSAKDITNIQFNNSFASGFDPIDYAKMMMDTKIALVPEGYLSNNSFRFFEAARSGTVIISAELYKYPFYDAFPGIRMRSWWGLNKEIRHLLNDKPRLAALQEQILRYYEDHCSEKAIAEYIVKCVEKFI